ncbi:MAG TPA: heparan-alpha-glucosaminide N-acetyltransferase domain-containing protein [Gemmatimonadaceae bacterium]|nr:heparan-alpha-glucosaminide N-acetyltransferase domain-containing protein [Gemmatimonadaceae bacterium]
MTTSATPGPRVVYHDAASPRERAPEGRRIASLDVVRGAVMVLMALDHGRWFLSEARFDPTDVSRTTAALFLTRWVTHFCAPAFVFLAGTGAWLYGARVRDCGALSRFLLTRGLWLVVAELTLVRFGWTFNLDYAHYALGGVIWMIGWCMVVMAALVRLPLAVVAALGAATVAGHDLLDPLVRDPRPALEGSPLAPLWQVLYFGGGFRVGRGGPVFPVLFSIVPWVGVMALGYAFGPVMRIDPERRRRLCLRIGLGATVAFVVLRALNAYGDPGPWSPQRSPTLTVLSFLNTNKYPASLLFLLMTLGPTIALLPALEQARGRVGRWLTVFGQVPFFYYILHLPAIHLVTLLFSLARYGEVVPWLTANQPMMPGRPPAGWGWGLGTVYLVTALVVVGLYFPCRWFAGVKTRRREGWLGYL